MVFFLPPLSIALLVVSCKGPMVVFSKGVCLTQFRNRLDSAKLMPMMRKFPTVRCGRKLCI